LGQIVEEERAVSQPRPDDLSPPTRQMSVRFAAKCRFGGVTAAMAKHHIWLEQRRYTELTSAEAEVEILVEQERRGIKWTEHAQEVSLRDERSADRPADRARVITPPWLRPEAESLRENGAEQRECECLESPGYRVGSLLHPVVEADQAGDDQRPPRSGIGGEALESPVLERDIGVEQGSDRAARPLQTDVVSEAEAALVRELDDLGASLARHVGTGIQRSGVYHHELRLLEQMMRQRAHETTQIILRVVCDDHD
jgi:hypothetical protein